MIRLPKSMLMKCVICGSYDVEFYRTLEAEYYCDDCFRETDWYDACLNTRFDSASVEWCCFGYWVEPQTGHE